MDQNTIQLHKVNISHDDFRKLEDSPLQGPLDEKVHKVIIFYRSCVDD
jgi:hypothetical protein